MTSVSEIMLTVVVTSGYLRMTFELCCATQFCVNRAYRSGLSMQGSGARDEGRHEADSSDHLWPPVTMFFTHLHTLHNVLYTVMA